MIYVTGATGFVGSFLVESLKESGLDVTGLSRRRDFGAGLMHDLGSSEDWYDLFNDADAIIHCAAANIGGRQNNRHTETTDFKGTLKLAKEASKRNVGQFIFLSTIKVCGHTSLPGRPFTIDDEAPQDSYSRQKSQIEHELRKLSGIDVVILRPPIIYGPGSAGNFKLLERLVESGLPLPFKGIKNKRSVLYLGNLADFIAICIKTRAKGTFHLTDGESLSTPELVELIADAKGVSIHLLPAPISLLSHLKKFRPISAIIARVLDSLESDMSDTTTNLGWVPPYSTKEGLIQSVEGRS